MPAIYLKNLCSPFLNILDHRSCSSTEVAELGNTASCFYSQTLSTTGISGSGQQREKTQAKALETSHQKRCSAHQKSLTTPTRVSVAHAHVHNGQCRSEQRTPALCQSLLQVTSRKLISSSRYVDDECFCVRVRVPQPSRRSVFTLHYTARKELKEVFLDQKHICSFNTFFRPYQAGFSLEREPTPLLLFG